jgi:hypothetical protein
MKRRIKNRHLGYAGQKRRARLDAGEVRRIVKRSQFATLADLGQNRFVNKGWLFKGDPAVDHAMTTPRAT